MDENGDALRVFSNLRLLTSSKYYASIKRPEEREWASIIEVVSAVGHKLKHLAILQGKFFQTT